MSKTDVKLRMRWAVVRPEMAAKWLHNANTHNRGLSAARVSLYAADMAAGRWLQSAQPILFDERGTLMDGQHRLAAIIESNTTQTFLIIEGINKSVQLVIDSGRPRNDADKLRLGRGMVDVTPRVVTTARAMMRPARYGDKAPRPTFTTGELGEFVARHKAAIHFAVGLFSQRAAGLRYAAAVVARAWYTQDRKRLADFADVLYSGINRGEKDVAAIRLRDFLSEQAAVKRSGGLLAGEAYGKIESALASFLAGAAPGRLVPVKGELFPLPGEQVTEPVPAAGGRLKELAEVD